jgi:hypothetical protein
MARAPVSKTGGWGFESLHSCHPINEILIYNRFFRVGNFSYFELVIFVHFSTLLTGKAASVFIIPLPLA